MARLNHSAQLLTLVDRPPPGAQPRPRPRADAGPCLPARLPSAAILAREARQRAHAIPLPREPDTDEVEALLEDALKDELDAGHDKPPSPEPTSPDPEPPTPTTRTPAAAIRALFRMGSHKLAQSHAPANTHAPTNRIPEPFEVLRAIERRDEMYLMDVRDRAFPLLLSTKAGDPPLLHALRIGASHRSIALLLVGAFSRYINNLEEQEMAKQGVRGVLKALRTNLKLAIDHDLAAERSDLAASFMQVLVMSEGERWVSAQAEAVGRELRVGVDRSGEGRRVLGSRARARKDDEEDGQASSHAPHASSHAPHASSHARHASSPTTHARTLSAASSSARRSSVHSRPSSSSHPSSSPAHARTLSSTSTTATPSTLHTSLTTPSSTTGRPVHTARAAVRKFATRELGRAELIASLEDYIGNATVDLLLLGAWGLAREVVGGEGISTSSFARDDRVYRAFCERLDGIGLSERLDGIGLSERLDGIGIGAEEGGYGEEGEGGYVEGETWHTNGSRRGSARKSGEGASTNAGAARAATIGAVRAGAGAGAASRTEAARAGAGGPTASRTGPTATSRISTTSTPTSTSTTTRTTSPRTTTTSTTAPAHKLPRKLRWQLRVLRAAVGGRRTTYRRKVELLEAELDDG